MLNNCIEGILNVELGVANVGLSEKFLLDFGLVQSNGYNFSTLNNSSITLTQSSSLSIGSITWAIDKSATVEEFFQAYRDKFKFQYSEESIECKDPSGIKLIFTKNFKREILKKGRSLNSWNDISRIDNPIPKIQDVNPIEIGHVVIETDNIEDCEKFYKNLGFVVSDRLKGRGVFLRCKSNSGHHDLFLVDSEKVKLNHIAFTMTDLYELLAAGQSLDSKGWNIKYGPGRHNISSAFFWYFDSPLGPMFEYSSNEDYLTDKWIPREIPMEKNLLSKESFISRV